MKVRITLKAKQDFGTTQKGETMIMYNEIFNESNGIAFFEIDRKQWEIVSADQYSGMKDDAEEKEIYTNDYVVAGYTLSPKREQKSPKVYGHVVFDCGCFSIDIDKTEGYCGYDKGQKVPLFDFAFIQIIKKIKLNGLTVSSKTSQHQLFFLN